jgi:hypothetical protein
MTGTRVASQPTDYRELAKRVRSHPQEARAEPPIPPPIVQLVKRKPWLAVRLLARDIPEPRDGRTKGDAGRRSGTGYDVAKRAWKGW